MTFGFAPGFRRLSDAAQNYWRGGQPVMLRIRNQEEDNADKTYLQLGMRFSPSGGTPKTGFTDIKIKPQPDVKQVSLHDIGLNQTNLMFGAMKFSISHNWVKARMREKGYEHGRKVFLDDTVIGLFHNNRLYSIDLAEPVEELGDIIRWELVCNAAEREVKP